MAKGSLRFITGISARLVQLLTGLISVLVVVRLMSPTDLGRFYLAHAIAVAACLSLLSPLHFPIQRITPSDKSEQGTFFASLVRGPFLLAVLLFCAWLVLRRLPLDVAHIEIGALTIFLALCEVMFGQGTNITSTLRQQGIYFFAVSLRAGLILGLLLLFRNDVTAPSALAIYGIASLLPFSIFSKEFRSAALRDPANMRHLRAAFAFGWPYVFSQALRQCVERGDRFIVAVTLGVAAAGQYAVAVDLCRRVIQGITINARLTYVRDAVEAYDTGNTAARSAALIRISNSVGLVGISLAATLAVFGKGLIEPLLGSRFSDEALAILPFCAVAFVLEAYKLYVHVLPFELARRAELDTLVAGIGVVVQIPLILLMGSLWGLQGVALALVAAQAAMLFAAYSLSRREVGFAAPWVRATEAALAAAVMAAVTFKLFPHENLSWTHQLGMATIFGVALTAVVAAILFRPLGMHRLGRGG